MPKVYAIANQKGGVGKTTTSVNLAACLAASNKRTLLIDMDPQGNATSGFGINKNEVPGTVYDGLLSADNDEVTELLCRTELKNLFVIPANIGLIGAQIELINMPGREFLLDKLIKKFPDFDYIIIDAPPSLGLLAVNVLCAADSVIIPIQCEYYALEGLGLLVNTINQVRKTLNPDLFIEGILLTMYDSRTNLSNEVTKEVRTKFKGLVFESIIRRSVKVSEAPSFGQPLILYDFRSTGAKEYIKLSEEVIERNEKESIR